MFILENYLAKQRQKIQEWEAAKKEWLAKDYHYLSDWDRHHPRPGINIKSWLQYLAVAIPVILFLIFVFSLIACSAEQHNKDIHAVKEGMSCRMFNKQDYVNIQSGDYENLRGHIVGGCNDGEAYQVKLDDNQKADVQGDGLDAVEVGGKIISIEIYKDLVVVDIK